MIIVMKKILKIYGLCILLLMVYVIITNYEDQGGIETISYSEFKQEVLSDRVSEITFIEGDIYEDRTIIGQRYDGSEFNTALPNTQDPELMEDLMNQGVRVSAKAPEQPAIKFQQVRTIIMIIAFILFIWLPFALWAAYLASNRDQSKILWFFLTLIFPIAILFIAFKDKVKKN